MDAFRLGPLRSTIPHGYYLIKFEKINYFFSLTRIDSIEKCLKYIFKSFLTGGI